MTLRCDAVIVVDGEFRALIPVLAQDERDGLEADIKENGCRDPLKVWSEPGVDDRAILLDGHNRYEICQHLGIEYETDRIALADRDAAKIWIMKNQLNRRDLSPYARAELVLKLEPLIAAKAKERQRQGGIEKVVQTSAQPKTRDELAKVAKVSHDTIAKVKVLAVKAPEAIKQKLRRGDTTINKEHKAIVGTNSGTAKIRTGPRSPQRDQKIFFYVTTFEELLRLSRADIRTNLAFRKDLATKLDRVLLDVQRAQAILRRWDEMDRDRNLAEPASL